MFVQRHRVINRTGNTSGGQLLFHCIPVAGQYDCKLVVDVLLTIFRADNLAILQQLAIPLGDLSALGIKCLNMLKLDAQQAGLNLIQTTIVAFALMVVLAGATVIA